MIEKLQTLFPIIDEIELLEDEIAQVKIILLVLFNYLIKNFYLF
jgi:hypothetical protein